MLALPDWKFPSFEIYTPPEIAPKVVVDSGTESFLHENSIFGE